MMDVAQYVIGSLMWSLFGLAAGYLLGHLEREVHQIKTKVVDEDDVAHPDVVPLSDHHHPTHRQSLVERVRRRFGLLLLLLAFLTVAQMSAATIANREAIECQNAVNRQLRADQVARAVLFDQDWHDIRHYLSKAAVHVNDPAARRRDLAVLNAALASRDDQRDKDPDTAYIADEC